MTYRHHTGKVAAALVLCLAAAALVAAPVAGQGLGGPLTVEGLGRPANPSAASSAFGGVTLLGRGETALMFVNPTALHALPGLSLSVGGAWRQQETRQVQQFAPVRYYPNLSLFLENMTDGIPDPDPDLVGFTPADTVQRPFDDIPPRWSHDASETAPLHALAAVPFRMGGVTFSVGAGLVRHAVLDHYYQNNNVLDPAVLATRPLPVLRPTDDNPVVADLYQRVRSREGAMNAYGLALAAHVERLGLTVGASGTLLRGESDDFERQLRRGRLTFLANEFRADSSYGVWTRTGTSDYSATAFTLGARLDGRWASLGLVLRPPVTYTRSFEMEVALDTTGTPATSAVSGEDRLRLPWRGGLGLLIQPQERLSLGLELELRPYERATLTSGGVETSPWESSTLFRLGVAYDALSWLTLRGGLRTEAEVFSAVGAPVPDDPVSYTVYSAGFGINVAGVRWNVSLENARVKYEDVWASEISKNSNDILTVLADVSFAIPLGR